MNAKKFMPLLGVMALGLVACGGGAEGPAMKGSLDIGGLPCTVELTLKEGNKGLFDFEILGDNIPDFVKDLPTTLDRELDYTVENNNYTFTGKVLDNKTQQEVDLTCVATYDAAANQHSLTYKLFTDLGLKEVQMTGLLPVTK